MTDFFDVAHLSVERLLSEWQWLCKEPMVLLARNVFGDLFLRRQSGKVFKLDIAIGQFKEITESEQSFRASAMTREKRQEWFAEDDALAAEQRGLKPNKDQCIGFKIPLVFAESGAADNAYVADLYEQVSFLGDLHRQISELPEGAKVKLVVKE